MADNPLRDWNLQILNDLYGAEFKLEAALPQITTVCQSQHLRGKLFRHLLFTKVHFHRLREILLSLSVEPNKARSPTMEGILDKLEDALESAADSESRDIVIIGSLLRAQRYLAAGYRMALSFGGLVINEEGLEALSESLDDLQASREEFEENAFLHFVEARPKDKLVAR